MSAEVQDSAPAGKNTLAAMEREHDELPINLERLREQWKELGLTADETYRPQRLSSGRIDYDEEPIEVAAVYDNADYENHPRSVHEIIDSLRQELEDTKEAFAKELTDTKESHLLELRSLKGLTLDLASLVYELTDEVRKDKDEAKKSWFKRKKK
jgi:hypothetical protein